MQACSQLYRWRLHCRLKGETPSASLVPLYKEGQLFLPLEIPRRLRSVGMTIIALPFIYTAEVKDYLVVVPRQLLELVVGSEHDYDISLVERLLVVCELEGVVLFLMHDWQTCTS